MKQILNHKTGRISEPITKRLDWITTFIPLAVVILLCVLFLLFPDGSTQTLNSIRFFLGDQMGSYYLVIGLGVFICSLYIAFSRYGQIKLGNTDQPDCALS